MNIFAKLANHLKESSHIKTLSSFVKEINKELNTLSSLDFQVPKKVNKFLSLNIQSDEYKRLVNQILSFKDEVIQHNLLVKQIDDTKTSFNPDEIISNPTLVNQDTLSSFEKTFNLIDSFKRKSKEYSDLSINLKDIVDNISTIKIQYNAYIDAKHLCLFTNAFYIDGRYKRNLQDELSNIIKSVKEAKKQYYDFSCLDSIDDQIAKNNKAFISNSLNDPIFDNVGGKKLDSNQRESILTDSVSNLTIAGAGCGKTTTICGKAKYLLSKGLAKPTDILLLSYSKNSSEDLKKKIGSINKDLEVRTFHSLGLDIISTVNKKKYTIEDQFDAIIERYFREILPTDNSMMHLVLSYYAMYFHISDNKVYDNKGEQYADLKNQDFKTIKDRMNELSDSTKVTLQKEKVKSCEELAIANFYFLNGIKYEYEHPYCEKVNSIDRRQYLPDFYLPDYKIYHEHYGINKEGRTPQYSQDEESQYLFGMKWKRGIHAAYHTVCLETFSYEFTDGTIFTKLRKELEEHNVSFHPLSANQISNALNSIYQDKDFKSLISLIKTFINLYKAKYKSIDYFDRLKDQAKKEFSNSYSISRAIMFLDICKGVYQYYISVLKEDKIDFDDMINQSVDALPKTNNYKYKYILVDEFQDISYSRCHFLKALIAHSDSKLFAVGDDWQAIYRFAGCDLNIFLNFKNYFADPTIHFLNKTYRNSQEIQDIMEPFIEKNPEQIKKHLVSSKTLVKPIRMFYYPEDDKSKTLEQTLKIIWMMDAHASVLLLGRNNYDIVPFLGKSINKTNENHIIDKDCPNLKITFKTIHSSKGLESDYVVIINNSSGPHGFPSTIEDDEVLSLVLGEKSKFPLAEERRLFYVAVTRTRNVTFLLVPNSSPSVFVYEIKDQASQLNQPKEMDGPIIYCPECHTGHLVIRKNSKGYFYGCSNYPYCDYTNGDVQAVKRNKRCPECGNFMVFRKNKNGHGGFWGCSSYPKCDYKEPYQPQSMTNNQYHNYRRAKEDTYDILKEMKKWY